MPSAVAGNLSQSLWEASGSLSTKLSSVLPSALSLVLLIHCLGEPRCSIFPSHPGLVVPGDWSCSTGQSPLQSVRDTPWHLGKAGGALAGAELVCGV